ncbi:MAG: hypothetical protein H7066_05805 [Cytophagaceae bacterium]|nr:hypothetical protein [Gemmatimonadaceae bacterium]
MTTSVAPIEDARSPFLNVRRLRPRLSILVLSRADEFELERAIGVLSDVACTLGAQVVVVREEATGSAREHIQRLVQKHQCSLAWVGAGSDRSAMTDEGLKYVTGDILTCRDDDRIYDGEWLSAFSRCGGPTARRVTEVDVTAPATDERGGRHADRPARSAYSTRRWIEASSEAIS